MNKQDFIKSWEAKQAKGKNHFILFDGILGWGVTVGILTSMLRLLFFEPTPTDLIVGFVGFLIGGFFWALMMWAMMEKKYQHLKALEEEKKTEFKKPLPIKMEKNIPSPKEDFLPLSNLGTFDVEDTTEDLEEKEMTGTIIEVPFINKGGRKIEGAESLFFQSEKGKYFIKFSKGQVLRTDIEKYIDQSIKIKAYKTFGQWDSDDPKVQSRVGAYVVISEIIA